MTKLYCDTSNLKDIKHCLKKYNISGVTTNPSIMRNEGVRKYKEHCSKILKLVKNKPFSVEVFAVPAFCPPGFVGPEVVSAASCAAFLSAGVCP